MMSESEFECIFDDGTIAYKMNEQNLDQKLDQVSNQFEQSRVGFTSKKIEDLTEIVNIK